MRRQPSPMRRSLLAVATLFALSVATFVIAQTTTDAPGGSAAQAPVGSAAQAPIGSAAQASTGTTAQASAGTTAQAPTGATAQAPEGTTGTDFKAQPLTLDVALALAPDASSTVLSARTRLAAAKRDEDRTVADPSSLRVDRISAHNAVDAAEGALAAAVAGNRVDVASAFFTALEADTSLQLAELTHDIASQTLAAQRARRDAGAATDLDVAKAENDERSGKSSIVEATNQRALAYAALAGLLGESVDRLAPSFDLPTLDTLDAYQQRASTENAQVISAADAVTLAQAKLDASDNDFTARADLESARQALSDATTNVSETKRTLQLNVASAFARAEAAAATVANASANDATAAQDLQTASTRLQAGSISQLAYRSSERTRAQAAQSLENARHAYANAVFSLEQTVVGR